MKKVELLSPAGGYDCFIAAVENGADAVYLGASSFNARNFANNFTDTELEEAINYAHARNVKVYITLNILLNDDEVNDAVSLAVRLHNMGADAFIVQDIGLMDLLKKNIPNVNIHVSTQATIYSSEGIKAIDSLDVSRVVLARELSLKEIENVCKNTDKEIEVFIHGALCVCYSGQCRLSSMVGERSGNRGKCAQPCRLPYTIVGNGKEIKTNYALSPKDLCTLSLLPDLIKAGVTSLKIEGRMKSPEYVACVTRIYRKYIDLYYSGKEYKVDENDIFDLKQVFNRGNFSTGYFIKNLGPDLMATKRAKNWGTYLGKVLNYNHRKKFLIIKLEEDLAEGDVVEILSGEPVSNIVTYINDGKTQVKKAYKGQVVTIGDFEGNFEINQEIYKMSSIEQQKVLRESFNGKFYKKIPVTCSITIKIGKNVELEMTEGNNTVKVVSDFIVEEAIKHATTIEDVEKSLGKLGDTPFILSDVNIGMQEDSSVPQKVLNELRRNAVEELIKLKTSIPHKVEFEKIEEVEVNNVSRKPKISVYLYNTKNLGGLKEADRVYVPYFDYINNKEEILSKLEGIEVIPYLRPITKNVTLKDEVESILVANLEHIDIFKNLAKNIYGDYSLNAFNSHTCLTYKKLGLKGINLSFELNLEQINNIKTDLIKEVTVYGTLPLMISEHCAIGSEIAKKIDCGLCEKGTYELKDRTGAKFPIITDRANCRSMILNSKKLVLSDAISIIEDVDFLRLYFYDETESERENIIKSIKENKKISCANSTAGLFYRVV
ncbi:MAG: U32 family peptidase [Clostridia bacterium]|nr:U32 family peptidase [Clostridia bacterium]